MSTELEAVEKYDQWRQDQVEAGNMRPTLDEYRRHLYVKGLEDAIREARGIFGNPVRYDSKTALDAIGTILHPDLLD